MRRIKLTVEYFGKYFFGFQLQPDGRRTVQGVLEEALMKVLQVPVRIVGSSRTDTGVHAKCQVVHFDTDSTIAESQFARAVNNYLPDDCKIVNSIEVDKEFHSRFSVLHKTYEYRFYTGRVPHPLKDEFSLHVFTKFDYELAKKSIECLVGRHDFVNLSSSGSDPKTTIRTIHSVSLEKSGDDYLFTICGDAFLYNMVRKIVGTMLQIAGGKRPPDYFEFLMTKSTKRADRCAPAKGLTLVDIAYQ